jgi:uncharacterized protein
MRANDDPLTVALTALIRSGDLPGLAALLGDHPALATERFGDEAMSRSVLHIATDWPANFPDVAATIALLVAAGAPVNARFVGPHEETPMHWAASADDVEAIDALLDAGADIEASGAVLTGGTALDDAVVFAQWKAARRLVQRGASMNLWHAAALGELATLESLALHASTQEITNACWHACRAGQAETAVRLVACGADVDWVGYDEITPRQAARQSGNSELVAWLATV